MADVRPLKIAAGKRKRFVSGDTVPVSNGGTGLSTIAASKLLGSSTLDTYTTYAIPLTVGNGGTGADLSATGGAGKFLKQASAGAAVTVASVTLSDLAAGTLAVDLVINAANKIDWGTGAGSGTASSTHAELTRISGGFAWNALTAESLRLLVGGTVVIAAGRNVAGTQGDNNWHVGVSGQNNISNTNGTAITYFAAASVYHVFQTDAGNVGILNLGRDTSGTVHKYNWRLGTSVDGYINNTTGTGLTLVATGNVLYYAAASSYHAFYTNAGGTVIARFGMDSAGNVANNNWYLGTAAGNHITNTDSASIAVKIAGTTEFTFAAGVVTVANPLKLGTANIVATGGSSAPTLGAAAIGGTGQPATAAQNGWAKFVDSTGATFWVPAWK